MNQEKIKVFETMVRSDYPEIAGIVVQKTAIDYMKTTLTDMPLTKPFMCTQ